MKASQHLTHYQVKLKSGQSCDSKSNDVYRPIHAAPRCSFNYGFQYSTDPQFDLTRFTFRLLLFSALVAMLFLDLHLDLLRSTDNWFHGLTAVINIFKIFYLELG